MTQVIPLTDTPAQIFNVFLGGRSCTLSLYQKRYTDSARPLSPPLVTSLFCDLYVAGRLVIGGVICENLNKIVRSLYLGFVGDLMFQDTQGSSDPSSPGLGSQYILLYLTPTEAVQVP